MTTNRHEMGRRQFLIVSSTAALASATLGPSLLAEGAAAAPKRLAVGFAPFGENARAVAAAAVAAADDGFISRGAQVTVFGPRLAAADPRSRRGVDLLAHYFVRQGGEHKSIPFRAWAGSRQMGLEAGVSRFTMPVDEVQKLVFTLEVERGRPTGAAATRRDAASESTLTPVALSLTSERDSLKLARGYYVIAPMFDGDADPRWSGYNIRMLDNLPTLADAAGNRAPFEHFVLRIDYANEA